MSFVSIKYRGRFEGDSGGDFSSNIPLSRYRCKQHPVHDSTETTQG